MFLSLVYLALSFVLQLLLLSLRSDTRGSPGWCPFPWGFFDVAVEAPSDRVGCINSTLLQMETIRSQGQSCLRPSFGARDVAPLDGFHRRTPLIHRREQRGSGGFPPHGAASGLDPDSNPWP